MKIRILIVDDEELARRRIELLAGEDAGIEVVGSCANAAEALTVWRQARPDVLFLDVQMPEMDGFELIASMPPEELPLVIFTTAFDQHAVRAFEENALDYLLKPFKSDRFKAAMDRARECLETKKTSAAARGLLDLWARHQALAEPAMPARNNFLRRLTVRTDDRVLVLEVEEIDCIESAGNYALVSIGKETHLLRETIKSLESQLDPEKFLRISRGAIVNLSRIRELHPMFKGEHLIVLKNGKKLPMSRGLREVEQALKFS